jgi:3-hydroxyisobutyrate dehydrogenase
METIGFIGIGKMGAGMARNLLKAGHQVVAYDVQTSHSAELRQHGAQIGESIGDVGRRSSTVITMLPSAVEVEAVALGEDGLRNAMSSGSVFVDMSTVGPQMSKLVAAAMRQKGIFVLDAPVSRGQEGASNGTLSIMVGGEREIYERTLPVLQAMGTDIFYCGPNGAGSAAKLVNNLIQAVITIIVSEGLVLGAKAEIDLSTLLKVLGASSADNFVLRHFFPGKALRGDFEPGGTINTVEKDLSLALELGHRLEVPLLLGALGHQLYGMMKGSGYGAKDFTAILTLVEEAAGVKVRL